MPLRGSVRAMTNKEQRIADKERWQNASVEDRRENYCKDCERSIWGSYLPIFRCDNNVENNGKFYGADGYCGCKVFRNTDEVSK